MATRKEVLEVGGREVTVSNPDKVYFPVPGYTKLDVVTYFLSIADGALAGVRGRPRNVTPKARTKHAAASAADSASSAPAAGTVNFRPNCGTSGLSRIA